MDLTSRLRWLSRNTSFVANFTFPAFPSGEFYGGKKYMLEGGKYSPYDSAIFVEFRAHGSDNLLSWLWDDESEDSEFERYFRSEE